MNEYGFNTGLLHGTNEKYPQGATQVPIYQSSAFRHDSAEDLEKIFDNKKMGFSYTRINNPTVESFEKRVTMLEDGIYYAGTDGAVDRVRPEHESEWEMLGRDLRDRCDHFMNVTEEAVDLTGRAAKRAGQGAKDAAEDAGRGLKEAGRDLIGK